VPLSTVHAIIIKSMYCRG